MSLEVEVKFHAADLAALARRLEAAGAVLAHARVHEVNTRFEDPSHSLLARGLTLRLRQDTRARLTCKAMVAAPEAAREMKVREELEVEVSDGARLQAILEQLGFEPDFVYEKYRATYRLGACEVVLDELPIGTFVEIEGAPEAVRAAAEALGLPWNARRVESYLELFGRVRTRLGLATRDMTFEAFQGVPVSPDDWGA